MWPKIKAISVKSTQQLRQNTVMYPVLLTTATGLLLTTSTSLSPMAIGIISAVSMGGFYLSARAVQFTMTMANEILITVQNVKTASENINNLTNEVQELVKQLNEKTTPELTNKIQEVADTLQDAVEDITDIAQTFKGGLQLNLGTPSAPAALAPPAETSILYQRERRRRRSPESIEISSDDLSGKNRPQPL